MNNKKRCFDICVSLLLGLVLIPIVLVIVIAMKLTSPGPVIFRQERIGRGGKTFLINKFRKFPATWGTQGPGVTLQGDSRMTNIGQFLERTKLDEIPQIWNILIGEMSFVGPRPESLTFSHLLTGQYRELLDYTPGLFGPNQVKYRNESAMYPQGIDPVEYYESKLFPLKANTDLEYFKTANLFSDVGWMIRGAYALLFNVVLCKKGLVPTLVLAGWDVIGLSVAWLSATWLKYSVAGTAIYSERAAATLQKGLLVLPLVMLVVFALVRVYRHPIRHFAETDAFRLIGAASTVWIASAISLVLFEARVTGLHLAVACLTSICLLVLPRAVCSWYYTEVNNRRVRAQNLDVVNALVCGVTPQSIEVASMLHRGFERANIVGLIDSDRSMVRREIRGFSVVGTYSDLDVIHSRFRLDQIWYGSHLTHDQQTDINAWALTNHIETVAIAALPGFRKLGATVPVGAGEYANAGRNLPADKKKSEVAA